MVRFMVRFRVNLTFLVTMILQHYRHIIMRYKYVHNALWIKALKQQYQTLTATLGFKKQN